MIRRNALSLEYSKGDKFIMSASKQAKAAGLDSLSQVAKMTGQSPQTLINWYNNKPELFNVVLAGCFSIYKKELLNNESI